MMNSVRATAFAALMMAGLSASARAQSQTGRLELARATEGDCQVTVLNVPAGTDIHQLALFVDDRLVTVHRARQRGSAVQLELFYPVRENSTLAAALTVDGAKTTTQVQQPTEFHEPPAGNCDDRAPRDDREVFEASGYLGWAFDNFAPSSNSTASTDPGTNTRLLAGVEAQYRLFGAKHDQFQIWLASYTLHGVRSADVNCQDAAAAALCGNNPRDKFFATYQNATSLEAHLDVRVEFKTLQRDSELPIKVFGVARFGFIDLTKDVTNPDGTHTSVNPPKVFNSNMLGVGILSPAGPFRDSSAVVGWGQSDQFESNPGWNRLKINGTLIFDLMPGLRDRLEFWKRLAGSPRAFVAIVVDRNPRGPGPDAVNTYIGIDVDLRHLFVGLGG